MRAKIARLYTLLDTLTANRQKVLRQGGKGWASRVAGLNVAYDNAWLSLRRTVQALYTRRVPV